MIEIEVLGNPKKGVTSSGKEFQSFDAELEGEKCRFTLWRPTPELSGGDKVKCQVTSKGEYRGKQSYWISDRADDGLQINGEPVSGKPATSPKPKAESRSAATHGPTTMTIEEAIGVCSFAMAGMVQALRETLGAEEGIVEAARSLVQTPLINMFNRIHVLAPKAGSQGDAPAEPEAEKISAETAKAFRLKLKNAPKELVEAAKLMLENHGHKKLEDLTLSQFKALSEFLFSEEEVPF